MDSLADGDDPAADIVEFRLRDDTLSTPFLERRQHDFPGFACVDREKEFFFVAEFHEYGIAVAGRVRPAQEKPGPDGEEAALLGFVDLNSKMPRRDLRSESGGAFGFFADDLFDRVDLRVEIGQVREMKHRGGHFLRLTVPDRGLFPQDAACARRRDRTVGIGDDFARIEVFADQGKKILPYGRIDLAGASREPVGDGRVRYADGVGEAEDTSALPDRVLNRFPDGFGYNHGFFLSVEL